MDKQNQENELTERWTTLLDKLEEIVGKKPADLNTVLFLIGVQELGQGVRTFTKEQKQDLMHIAICRILSKIGVYELEGMDEDGWPHWKLVKKLPGVDINNQEQLLKTYAIEYFEDEGIL